MLSRVLITKVFGITTKLKEYFSVIVINLVIAFATIIALSIFHNLPNRLKQQNKYSNMTGANRASFV